MDILYQLILYIHIFSVILSIGPFFVLIPMVRKLRLVETQEQHAYLDAFRFVVRLAKHAGHVLVISGFLLILVGSWSWKTSWIVMTIIILIGSLFFLARAFSPTLRRLHESSLDREASLRKLNRSLWIYIALLMTMMWFMVTKPVLW